MWILEVNVDAVSVNAKLSLSAPIKFLLIYFKQYVFAVKSNYNINRASEIRIHTIQEVAVENYSQTSNPQSLLMINWYVYKTTSLFYNITIKY